MNEAASFSHVTKTYGHIAALRDLTFSVHEGELYGLIGPNGAGKTTAIRILSGLVQATSGEASVLGMDCQDPQVRPLVGYMPQETALYQDLTVQENLEFFGQLYGIGPKELRHRIKDLLAFVDLTPRRNTLVANLSGGMKHRTSLAATLIPKPRLLVLDEPTVGVDPELRATFWERFAQMQKEGTTILITTHYMDEARRCQRVGLISSGTIIAEGSPSDLLHQTKTDNLEDAFLCLAGRHKEGGA